MEKRIKILHLEDSQKDFELIQSIIESGNIEHKCFLTDNEKDFVDILHTENIDIILADYKLPDYSGNEALKVIREKYSSIPFIFVSGTIGEDAAINAMLNGATDYVLKNKLERLVPAIKRAVNEREQLIKQNKIEKSFQESEEKFRSIMENSADAIFIANQQVKYIYTNKKVSAMLGYTSEEMKSKSIADITNPTKYEEIFKLFNQVLSEGKSYSEIELLKKDGNYISTDLNAVLLPDGMIYSSCRDISERKNAEEVLLQSEAKFRKFINSLPDPVLVVDKYGKIVYCNQIAMKTFGYTIDQMLGCQIETLMPRQNRDHHLALRNDYLLKPVSRSMGGGREVFAQRKDGSHFPTEIMLEPVEINNKPFTLAIVRDISERKQAEKELIAAKEKAEESDRLKSAFLANMSHEVRTPLNSIIGFSELLADPAFEAEQRNEFIHQIVTNGNHLLTIISDIMDISKMESGEITIRKTQVNAGSFMSALRDQFSFQAEAKNLELQLILPDTAQETFLVTDAGRLNQIFNNLISNAIKFTPKGQIAIGFHPYDNLIEFFVTDTGIGIAEENQEKIFERFRQVEDAKTRTYGGNGLGLAISKNLVELMGGKIWVESEPGKGSTFYFTIPVGRG